ncbi:MAG: hypothetical protein WD872_05150 [Pirellulaceae bacterium]
MRVLQIAIALIAAAIPGWCWAAEPQGFAADAFAQPIAARSTPSAPTSAAPLRWKSKPLAGSPAVTHSPRMAAVATPARGWNKTRMDGQVQPAQAIASDPFTDPFGDRGEVRQTADIELEPTEAELGGTAGTAAAAGGVEELPAPRHLRSVTSPAATPIEPSFTAQPTPPAPELTPPPPGRGMPCDRIYNDRNCCDVAAGCKAFRDQLISDSIRTISLDITPRFMPDLPLAEDEATRADRLRLLESRDWRNRRDEVIATGTMTNLANGRVVIADESGEEVARIPWQELGEDELCYINAYWRLPVECPLGGEGLVARNFLPSTFHWHASALCHKPLYFEEIQLERYGHTAGPIRQPIISGAHFFVNIAALPYKMAINPPHECQYALGYYRPGNCAPWMIQPIPLSLRGAAAQATAVVGGFYLLP